MTTESAVDRPGESSEPVVTMNNVGFSYVRHEVLTRVSLSIDTRDFVAIVGPNGGGKTTLLKLMLGLLTPTRGTVRVFGRKPAEVRVRMGYMPQHAHLDPQFPVDVMDVTLMGRIGRNPFLGPYRASDKRIAEKALRRVEMWEMRKVHFSDLSGGQRQRVLIARALATEPELLLLDEPTAGLDLTAEAELYDFLKELNEELTVVVVSHDLGFVSRYVNKVVCVKQHAAVHPTSELTGELIQQLYGSPMKLVRHDLSEKAGDLNTCFPS